MIRSCIAVSAILILISNDLEAQDARRALERGRYSTVISSTWPNAQAANVMEHQDIQITARALFERARFFQAMSLVQSSIGHAYYTRRDTSSGFVDSPLDNLFRGRYALELEKGHLAAQILSAASSNNDLDAEFRQYASVWAEAAASLESGTGAPDLVENEPNQVVRTESEYIAWRFFGAELQMLSLAPGNSFANNRLRLWQAAFEEDIVEFRKRRDDLVESEMVDATYSHDAELTIRYYDPSTMFVLAFADWHMAEYFFSQDSGNESARTFAGICSYNSRNYESALSHLDGLEGARATLYRGLANEALNAGSGTRLIQEATNKDPKLVYEWLALDGDAESVGAAFAMWSKERNTRSSIVVNLALALIQIGRFEDALSVIGEALPSHRRRPGRMYPLIDAVEISAMMGIGRMYYPKILERLAMLSSEYRPTRMTLDVAQGLAAPDRDDGGKQLRTGM